MEPLANGTLFGDFRIDGVLGRGGMGVVYEARQLSLDRTVALKLIAPALGNDADLLARFRREALAQAAIEHPHIVPVYEAGDVDERPYIAMRIIHGRTLKEQVSQEGLAPERALRLLSQVADALATAHAAGLIHRDVKPQNVLLGARDHAYLADFGLTRALGADSLGGLTASGQVLGTVDYLSPEQIEGRAPTASSDVYALAATLYECLTGAVPFPRDSGPARMFAHLSEPPPRVSAVRPELPPALDDTVRRGMSKDPLQRPTALELVEDASRALRTGAGRPGGAGATESATQGRRPTPIAQSQDEPDLSSSSARRAGWRRHPVGGTLAGVASAAASVATAITLFGGDKADEEAAGYKQAIAGICTQLDRERAGLPARDKRLRGRVVHAPTLVGQRDALLEEHKHNIAVDADALGRLEALTPPSAQIKGVQTATSVVWARNLRRRQGVRDGLGEATSYPKLLQKVKDFDRSAFEREGRTVTSGLRRLGDGDCELRRTPDRPVIPLTKPRDVRLAERRAASRRARAKTEDATGEDVAGSGDTGVQAPQPDSTAPAPGGDATPPAAPDASPEPAPTPPDASPPGGGGGGGGGLAEG